jgi:hypothetical protein
VIYQERCPWRLQFQIREETSQAHYSLERNWEKGK